MGTCCRTTAGIQLDSWDCSFGKKWPLKVQLKKCQVRIMEVLRSTFLEKLPEIESAIEHADYIAIDTELTGTHTLLSTFNLVSHSH